MSNKKKLLMSAVILGAISAPAFASDAKKMKEVKSIVGYNVTETQVITGPKAKMYKKMDMNNDGTVTYKEYSSFSNLDDEYSVFLRMDKDGSKNLSYDEFATFNNTGKGSTQFESELHGKSVKGTNLKTRSLQAPKSYFVPVEPEVVSVEEIQPAAQ